MLEDLIFYLHILSVIVSIGPFFVLFPMINKLKSIEYDALPPYLDTISFIVWITKHAGHVLTVTGLLLIWIGGFDVRESWIDIAVIILLLSLFFLARAFSPTLKKLRVPHQNREELVRRIFRSLLIYLFVMLLTMWLMVDKPTFWTI
ncbi:MAG: hypothetical protein A2189_05660 [Paenibacillus sp. RIFOXYA1_FULL_44_5]|nr:MAG: hypothetical protein A2189_05660 [Paenibacillus sp. RIFOXYA1_FULL_44_5]